VILRNYQERGVEDIRAAFRRGRKSIAYVAPTGSGKTVLMTYIARGAMSKSNRIMIVVHRQELIRQTSRALEEMGVPHSFITADRQAWPETPVQLAMIQTLCNRTNVVPPQLLMIDEYHHGVSESYLQTIARFPEAKILGLTATPQRLDGKGLGSICEELILGPTVQELIDRNFLSRPVYYAPPTDLDMSGVRKTAGDFNRRQTEERVDRPKITGSAVEHYLKICPGVPAVAFCATVKHAEHVRDQFNAAGIASASIDGTLDDDTRIDRVAALSEGRIKVLTSVDVISEGFDLPICACAILLRPTESLALHLQQVGRILRPVEGKVATVLDHVGNCMRHGLAEEPREWTLAGKIGKKKSATAVQEVLCTCPECHAVHVSAPACPQCGHAYPVRERTIAETDGMLAQLTAATILAERERIKKRQAVGMAKTRAELEAIAKARGYSPKWVPMMLALRARKNFAAKTQTFVESTRQASLNL
jgi:DNA repair protein RadD